MCHFPLTYDDILIFFILYNKNSFITVFLSNYESVVSWYFLSRFFLNQSNNYIKFDFQYRYIPTLEATQFPLHKISKHQTAEQYLGSANFGEIDIKSDVNRLATGKLPQSTTVYSQYE